MLRGLVAGGSERPPFRYVDKGMMATVGRKSAVASIKSLKLKGFFAWLAWLFVHIIYLIGFRNRLSVLINWFYSYVTYRRGARLITGGRMEAGAPERRQLPREPAEPGCGGGHRHATE
jgi:NADH dehydrogenase